MFPYDESPDCANAHKSNVAHGMYTCYHMQPCATHLLHARGGVSMVFQILCMSWQIILCTAREQLLSQRSTGRFAHVRSDSKVYYPTLP